jgi:hypothetical protein
LLEPAAEDNRKVEVQGSQASAGPQNERPRALCVFDYDLTLSSNACEQTDGDEAYFCRQNICSTYGWYGQCLGVAAQQAVAECVERGAFIGIASHADADGCWVDKVLPVVEQQQFPEFTNSRRYDNPDASWSYPRIDDRNNWNCDNCAYTMDGGVSKPEGIRRIMRHYGLDTESPEDRARVIFWDDTPDNIVAVNIELPEAHAIEVPRFTPSGADGGCGLTKKDIKNGWDALRRSQR